MVPLYKEVTGLKPTLYPFLRRLLGSALPNHWYQSYKHFQRVHRFQINRPYPAFVPSHTERSHPFPTPPALRAPPPPPGGAGQCVVISGGNPSSGFTPIVDHGGYRRGGGADGECDAPKELSTRSHQALRRSPPRTRQGSFSHSKTSGLLKFRSFELSHPPDSRSYQSVASHPGGRGQYVAIDTPQFAVSVIGNRTTSFKPHQFSLLPPSF